MIARDYPSLPRNFIGISPPYSDWQTARVVVLPVPYDSTAEWKSGSRNAPREIIDASSYLELYDTELNYEIVEVGIHTLDEIEPLMAGPEQMIKRVHRVVKELLREDKVLFMLGGEHSLTLGALKAMREKYEDLSVLQLDAHTDLRDEYLGTAYSHATVMRRALELCPVVPAGIRSMSLEERKYIIEKNIRPYYAEDIISGRTSPEEVAGSLTANVYITIDLDVFDPSVMPAVGTPEPGGLDWYQVLALLREVTRSRRVVGFDLMEMCPAPGLHACSFLAAKLAYKLIGYIFRGTVSHA